MGHPALYLIPSTLGDTPVERLLPSYNTEIVSVCVFYCGKRADCTTVSKKCHADIDIDKLTFYELNKHTNRNDIPNFFNR